MSSSISGSNIFKYNEFMEACTPAQRKSILAMPEPKRFKAAQNFYFQKNKNMRRPKVEQPNALTLVLQDLQSKAKKDLLEEIQSLNFPNSFQPPSYSLLNCLSLSELSAFLTSLRATLSTWASCKKKIKTIKKSLPKRSDAEHYEFLSKKIRSNKGKQKKLLRRLGPDEKAVNVLNNRKATDTMLEESISRIAGHRHLASLVCNKTEVYKKSIKERLNKPSYLDAHFPDWRTYNPPAQVSPVKNNTPHAEKEPEPTRSNPPVSEFPEPTEEELASLEERLSQFPTIATQRPAQLMTLRLRAGDREGALDILNNKGTVLGAFNTMIQKYKRSQDSD